MEEIDLFIRSGKDILYLFEPDNEKRKIIHKYVKDKFSSTHISRTEYMSHGLEVQCCEKWYRSSKYGESWNGGSIICDICKEITYLDFDDCEDACDSEYRLSNYKPTEEIIFTLKMILKYKNGIAVM
jgi:hypothetical protein